TRQVSSPKAVPSPGSPCPAGRVTPPSERLAEVPTVPAERLPGRAVEQAGLLPEGSQHQVPCPVVRVPAWYCCCNSAVAATSLASFQLPPELLLRPSEQPPRGVFGIPDFTRFVNDAPDVFERQIVPDTQEHHLTQSGTEPIEGRQRRGVLFFPNGV